MPHPLAFSCPYQFITYRQHGEKLIMWCFKKTRQNQKNRSLRLRYTHFLTARSLIITRTNWIEFWISFSTYSTHPKVYCTLLQIIFSSKISPNFLNLISSMSGAKIRGQFDRFDQSPKAPVIPYDVTAPPLACGWLTPDSPTTILRARGPQAEMGACALPTSLSRIGV